MSKIKSKWTSQEQKIHGNLKARGVRHKMHPNIPGSPDLILKDKKVAVFINGCFWHKCPKCYKAPKSNVEYWLPKIERNVKRDKNNARLLKKDGWKVVSIWEHEIKKDVKSTIEKISR